MPPELHERLKEDAKRHYPPMGQIVIDIVKDVLWGSSGVEQGTPVKGNSPVADKWLAQAKNRGRA